jgi:hypothetical protein
MSGRDTSGTKANFGVAGGIKHGTFWGHLTYIEHDPKNQKVKGTKVKGTSVTVYAVVDARTRHIEGTAEINGHAGYTYRLWLLNGYTASDNLAGGNIQMHRCTSRAIVIMTVTAVRRARMMMNRMTATAVATVRRAGRIADLRPLGPTGGAICVAPPGTRGRAIVVARKGKTIA